jgi:hypothetical protein
LSAFVSSFEGGQSFNETDLSTLGIDLNYDRPLLPMLHSVLSEAPLLGNSSCPIPDWYGAMEAPGSLEVKILVFPEPTLIFLFETGAGTEVQKLASAELIRRGYVFEDDTAQWIAANGNEWDVDAWKEVEAPAARE